MKLLRYILFPVVPIYYLVTWLRNTLYDIGIFKSTEYTIPTICVGNLSVGGTGKTPMIEYLIRLLAPDFKLATLSRGYKRLTKGFIIAGTNASARTVGDEPFQFYNKFKEVIVSVDADRRHGISHLMDMNQPPDIILMDDAFQHRKLKAGFNVLLTAYDNLYVNDFVLPTGNLREPKSGAKRADVIVVTKCPESLSEDAKKSIRASLKPTTNQQVFFSTIRYSNLLISNSGSYELHFLADKKFSLVTGIANSKPLVEYLESKQLNFEHLNFADHHEFSEKDIQDIKSKEWIVTTEKDFMRLSPHFADSNNLLYLPIAMTLDAPEVFEQLIRNYIRLKL